MFELNFAHLCDYASLSEGGKLNVLGVFKNINSSNFPYTHPQMYITVNVFFKDPGKYKEVIRLSNGKGNQLAERAFEFEIYTTDKEMGIIGQLNNIEFNEAGEYKIEITVNDRLLKRIPLSLIKV